ncbi:uncharacterized protein LOC142325156 isoform X2 [Lycorma delicatula]|uniref:uncharacterized protein LOC142325156 isoform X2 n=1 Tax=Lycorma delicatula TaxID=130591 RepID=UPI003F50F7DA
MTNKQEVAQLRKALEKERNAVRSAQDEVAALRAALDSERSAVRALRRDITSQIKKVREEEAEKYTALIEQLKKRTTLEQEEALKSQKENIQRAMTAEYQRLQQSREAEFHRESNRKEEDLRRQLRDALNRLNETTNKTVNSLQPVISAMTSTTTTAVISATINNNEIQALRAQNKQFELRIQELLEAERRNADCVRTQHEEHLAREAEFQKISRRETHLLLEKLKSKDRMIETLGKELRKLKGRLETSCRNNLDIVKPGEPPRLGIKKRLILKNNGLSADTLRTRSDPIKETSSNDTSDQHSCCDNSNFTNQETDAPDKKPIEENNNNIKTKDNGTNKPREENNDTLINNEETENLTESPVQETDIAINSWTKAVGIETLYQVVVAEHQELQRAHQALAAKLRAEQQARADLEASIQQNRSENPINLALAAQIQELTARQAELISENHELREQNDLLEFRLLEIDSAPSSLHFKTPSSPSRSPESRGDREVDDISDSGVLSLPTSEDISETDFHELAMEPSNRDIKSKLSHLCQTMENISDRISIQQGLALLRHYEARLEATLANMSPDLSKTVIMPEVPSLAADSTKSQSRIIATVLPFTDLSQTNGKQKDELPIKKLLKDVDCLQESGIFEESSESPEYCNRCTQTDWSPEKLEATAGDLSLEIRKLKQIRERIEEQGGNKRLLRSPGEEDQCQSTDIKELLFYRDRVETLENKLAIYESSGDEQIRRLNTRLEKEILLSSQVKHLKERCNALEELNRRLEEEKCEFEEAENDTRLRCQKLEVKLSALGEKKSDLQVQLQQNARTMANLKSCLAEEEKKRIEARQHATQMDALVQCYEQRNFELEEKEMEARCKVQMLEGAIPALVAYNTFKTTNNNPHKNMGSTTQLQVMPASCDNNEIVSKNDGSKCCGDDRCTAEKLYISLKSLEDNITKECEQLHLSKSIEHQLRKKINDLEHMITLKNKEFKGCVNAKQKEELMCEVKYLNIEKKDLLEKIKDLEMKESYYKQTLQQADEMWATMEREYKDQIHILEHKIDKKKKELQDVEALMRKLCQEKEQKNRLQERVCCLESELRETKCKLAEKEMQKKLLEKEEHRLCCELAASNEELNYMKNCIEPSLKKQLEQQKKMVKDLEHEISTMDIEKEQDFEDRHAEVSSLKRKINSLSKELLENECTISELREEVQTLEIALNELREKFIEEQDVKERLIIKMTSEIEDKSREINLLKQKSEELPKSAKQELEEAENLQKLLNWEENSNNRRSKSQRRHKAKCHLTLKKLNEKIKAGLLVDESQLNSICSSSSGDDSSNESVQNRINLESSLMKFSETEYSENVKENLSHNIKLDEKIKERFSNIVPNSDRLLDGYESPSLRLEGNIKEKDDPYVDCESTEEATSSRSFQDDSIFHIEESIHRQKMITSERNTGNTSATQRLNSAIKHSTVSDIV